MRHAQASFFLLLSIVMLGGCGGGSDKLVKVHPVSGELSKGGEPLAGAEVVLYPIERSTLPAGTPFPKARTDDDGWFQLRTFDPADGAPAGKYALTVKLPVEVETPDGQLIEQDRLNGAYSDPDKPVQTVEVVSGGVQLGAITIE